jgi:C1A family cysteine protease
LIASNIDLRVHLQPVRHQGRRQSCLAFASSTAHEHQAGTGEHLSVEYLFFHAVARMPGANPSSGLTMMAAADALAGEGQPVETAWPYSPIQVMPWAPPAITTLLHKTVMAPGKLTFDEIVAVLDQSRPVILGLVITDAFYRPDASGRIPNQDPDIERAGHAVLAVGHGISANGTPMLLVRNSWGEGWGLGGHAWLSRIYLERHLHETGLLT